MHRALSSMFRLPSSLQLLPLPGRAFSREVDKLDQTGPVGIKENYYNSLALQTIIPSINARYIDLFMDVYVF